MSKKLLEVATLGGGCFWCVEAVFERVEGVVDVVSGYAGGHKKDPTYNFQWEFCPLMVWPSYASDV